MNAKELIKEARKEYKMTFGLTEKNKKRIEEEFAKYETVDIKFDSRTWEYLGKELGWCPITLALWYMKERFVDSNKIQNE